MATSSTKTTNQQPVSAQAKPEKHLEIPRGRPRVTEEDRGKTLKSFRISLATELAIMRYIEAQRKNGVTITIQGILEGAFQTWFNLHRNNGSAKQPITPQPWERNGLTNADLHNKPFRIQATFMDEVQEFILSELAANRRWKFQTMAEMALGEWMAKNNVS